MPRKFEIRKLVTPSGQWVEVKCKIPCSRIVIENFDLSNNIVFRTDKDDPETEKQIPMGQELDLDSHGQQPWLLEERVGWVMNAAVAPAGPVVVSFTT